MTNAESRPNFIFNSLIHPESSSLLGNYGELIDDLLSSIKNILGFVFWPR